MSRSPSFDTSRAAMPTAALDAAAERAGALLSGRGDTVAVVESTSAGLVNAALQGVPKASSYLVGALTVYSLTAANGVLPREVLEQLGRPRDNYASASAYRESKRTFCLALAWHARERFGATWAVAESGAAEVEGLPAQLKAAGVFTALAVVGPQGFEHCVFLDLSVAAGVAPSRREAMQAFALGALEVLE
eukprot:CAMPEP_0183440790 /NCGR_PEP_ID=MMETSP0370-20130417/82735_1 /TAXON_ID=268820 /ORGANISM="Peridinium aciculiferum, Strain PAER-2" /LENGTH=190 /DNA_ID=CAMNT_0025629779 /DNA_START=12 /DNA_END=581 /DNA_ORIENTATION=+